MLTAELGKGIYAPTEAARLAHLDVGRVRRWIGGYDYKGMRGDKRSSPPLFRREHSGDRLGLTFLDLVEVLFVKTFLDNGVSIHTVRHVQATAAAEFSVRHPFCVKRFETDGETILERFVHDGKERLVDRKRMQMVDVTVFNPLLRALDYDQVSEEAHRWWPLGKSVPVVVDPLHSFGSAVSSRSGVPTRSIFASFLGGESKQDVASWFEIDLDEVEAAIEFEKSIARRRSAAA